MRCSEAVYFSGIHSRTCAFVLSNLKKINKPEVQSPLKMQGSSKIGNKVTVMVAIFLKYVLWCNLEVEVFVVAVSVSKGLYLLSGWTS